MRLFPLASLSLFDRQVISAGIQPWRLLEDYNSLRKSDLDFG